MSTIAILSYNAGNTLSVESALKRLGAKTIVTDSADAILNADKVIFPGVGHALPAANYLKSRNLDKIICSLKQPVLGICLGMQLMCQMSEEGNTTGLGIISSKCRRFRVEKLKVPHMGWNSLSKTKGALFKGIEDLSYFYFVHSFRIDINENTVATCQYGEEFSAAIQKDNFYGVQFHPEKSSSLGQKILQNFLEL